MPEIAPRVARLHVFQRTPNWVLPKDDTPYSEEQKEAFRSHPALMAERRQDLFEKAELETPITRVYESLDGLVDYLERLNADSRSTPR